MQSASQVLDEQLLQGRQRPEACGGAALHQCVDKARARAFEIVPRTAATVRRGGRKLVAFSELSALRCGEIRATS